MRTETKVTFVSRAEARKMIESGVFSNGTVDLVSISDTNKEKKEMQELWASHKGESDAAIFLNFLDINDIACQLTDAKVNKILEFTNKTIEKRKDLVVHCFMGISRSGAVAKFVNEYWGLGDRYLEEYSGHNLFVYYTLLERAGVPTLRSYYTKLEQEK